MAAQVIQSWKVVTEIENYQAVAGEMLFRRYVQCVLIPEGGSGVTLLPWKMAL